MNDLIINDQFEIITKKLEELSASIITRANEDRVTAKQIYDFIKQEIAKIEEEYEKAAEEYEKAYDAAIKEQDRDIRFSMIKNLGRRPYKKSIVDYIEQLNKSLEMSIKSSDSVVNLLSTIAKTTSPKNNIKEVNIDNRKLIMEKIFEEDRVKQEEANRNKQSN